VHVTIAELLGHVTAKEGEALEPAFSARDRVRAREAAEAAYRTRFPNADDVIDVLEGTARLRASALASVFGRQ
jgi:hypothetical protein